MTPRSLGGGGSRCSGYIISTLSASTQWVEVEVVYAAGPLPCQSNSIWGFDNLQHRGLCLVNEDEEDPQYSETPFVTLLPTGPRSPP